MKIIRRKKDLKKIVNVKNISLIPTMGGLHKGHEFLIKKAIKKKTTTIVSIFVNPKQFNSRKDFLTYPRNFKKDINILKRLRVDYLYIPNFKDIFSFKTKNLIHLNPFYKRLCGKFRPGHFKGVLNIVNRLLELIKPKYIYLGQKDFQQLVLIKKHIYKNHIRSTIVSCKTIRLKNKLPYSSRNFNLSNESLYLGSKIIKLIEQEKKIIKRNKLIDINLNNLKKNIKNLGVKKIDYIEAINLNNLKKAKKYNEKFNIFSAFYLEKVRIIDNI